MVFQYRDINEYIGFKDQFSCGNFWDYLMDTGTILPQNLIFIGVADYPEQKEGPKKNIYQKTYLDFEARGCAFFPRQRFEGQYADELCRFLRDKIKAPNVYISLDLDVGSYSSTYAARYMDRPPSTWSRAPVMYAAFSEARKAIAGAISLGSPNRPTGT